MTINEAFQLAIQHHQRGDFEQAEHIYREILNVQPANVHCYNNLGIILENKGQLDEAINSYQKALQIDPAFVRAYYNLGTVLTKKYQFYEAIQCFEKVLQLDQSLIEAYVAIGNILKNQGRISEAEKYYKHAIQIKPDWLMPHEALLLAMNYNSGNEPKKIYFEHLKYAKTFAEPLYPTISSYDNEPIPSRILKVGYVSPDFRRHSVAYFIEPVLISHNREHFEMYCYSDVATPDDITRRIQTLVQWRSIGGMSDEKAADLIRSDRIDILVDLAGYTIHNRMFMFARKPAPVQATWIGYPSSTGILTIDYKIVDKYTDPQGIAEQFYTEKLIRLPENFLCYLPPEDCPTVGKLPALSTGHITFGSFNNLSKISGEVIMTWGKILKAIPESLLVLKTFSLSDEMTRSYVRDMFRQQGINTERIELLSAVPSIQEHLRHYHRIDISLDTFPYTGTTTTCEALLMGVPVISLAGTSHASRVGVSLLSNAGLPELIAMTPNEYVEIAVNLARDLKRLQSLREHLRDMIMHSPLCNAKRFTLNLELCYRKIWENWCKSQI